MKTCKKLQKGSVSAAPPPPLEKMTLQQRRKIVRAVLLRQAVIATTEHVLWWNVLVQVTRDIKPGGELAAAVERGELRRICWALGLHPEYVLWVFRTGLLI